MSKSIFVFPGQGSQSLGMGKDFFDESEVVKYTFQEVADAIGYRIDHIIFGNDESALVSTKNAQIAILTVSISALRVLMEKTGKKLEEVCSFVAGHSVGQYSALCAAGVLSLEDTAKLLLERGIAMEEAAKYTIGGMAAILGGDEKSITDLISVAGQGRVLVVANYNSPDQVVISGENVAVERACELAPQFNIKRAIKLNVSGGFHSPLMAGAKDVMAKAVQMVKFNAPVVPVIDNTTANTETEPEKIKSLLVAQVDGSVQWTKTMQTAQSLGVTKLFEVGNGKVLTGLCKKTAPEIETTNLNTMEAIEQSKTLWG